MTCHVVSATTIGAGTGDTYYVGTCTCGWTHQDYSPMSLLDRATMHQQQAAR